jgi:hypothetical protein
MSTHVHLVVESQTAEGARVLNLFKGVSSRRLGQAFGRRPNGHWWTQHGSHRLLPSQRAVVAAISYVLNQPNALKIFEYEPRSTSGARPSRGIHAADNARRRGSEAPG